MRLGQLARKLNIRPSDVLAALPPGSVQPESNSNTRLSDDQVKEVIQFFVPDNWKALVNESLSEDSADMTEEQVSETPKPPQKEDEPVIPVQFEISPAPPYEKPELIKAPKVELPGLKVVGKIELPEKKAKDVAQKEEAETSQSLPEQKGTWKNSEKYQQANRNRKNPVALARERQQREMEKQKKVEAEVVKQKRTKKYLEKVSGYRREKVAKSDAKPIVIHSTPSNVQAPSSAWGKFKRWLFRE